MSVQPGFSIPDIELVVLAVLRAADYKPLPAAEIARRANRPLDDVTAALESLDRRWFADHWHREGVWLISHTGTNVCLHQGIGVPLQDETKPLN